MPDTATTPPADRAPRTEVRARLLHEIVLGAADRDEAAVALRSGPHALSYGALAGAVQHVSAGLLRLGLRRADRVAIWLDKRVEAVAASFGAAAAGGAFVPVNPVLKPAQVLHVLRDSGAVVLVTSAERLDLLANTLPAACPHLRHVVLTGVPRPGAASVAPIECLAWGELLSGALRPGHPVISEDMAAIFYTSGSTGQPKGVVLPHRSLVIGAQSVCGYLDNRADDTLLAVLPLSFDAGFSQLTTGFLAGGRVVLLNHLMPQDVLQALASERVTGLTAVPPLYIQLARLAWPATVQHHLRYFANTGGHLPRDTLAALRARVPAAKPFLMYGLTEAFRSTYLPPAEVDRRPDSIGQAIPEAEVLVLRPDGRECGPDEPGELVHRGPLVSLGYWNAPDATAERFKPLPPALAGRPGELQLPELAVYSGDVVRRDADGFLYFVGRRDEMIKTSGYRLSPTEIEDIVFATGLVGECVALGLAHPILGQAVHLLVSAVEETTAVDLPALQRLCRAAMPAYMQPQAIHRWPGPLPRGPNGKIDRAGLKVRLADQLAGAAEPAASAPASAPNEPLPPAEP